MADDKVGERGKEETRVFSVQFTIVLAILSFTLAVIFQNPYEKKEPNTSIEPAAVVQSPPCPEPPKYWGLCFDNWIVNGNLRTMDRVFDRLGYVSVNGSNGDDWDVLWSIEYPFLHPDVNRSKLYDPLNDPIKLHQRINRFPGINFIAAKSYMTTRNRNIKYILPGFVFPRMVGEFKAYVEANPNARFVEKAFANRGIRLVEKHEIVYDKSNKFYQRFMEKPFLVDGRFMDFGVYALISSINPLRLYRYAQEVHLRFCPEPYYPFDAKNLDKYVIGNNRQDFPRLPETKIYFDTYGFSFKLSIEDYFRKKGHNVTELWRKIDEAIVQLVLNNEENMVKETRKFYNSSHHFFELVRFDFILNEDLEPHITEVNMSPAVTPNSDVAERFTQTYEQLIYETLQLVGAGSKLDLISRYDNLTKLMFAHSKNIGVNPGLCVDNNCDKNCNKPECELCLPCLSEADLNDMLTAYREQLRRGGFKRIFPAKTHFNQDYIARATPKNQKSLKWFREKCNENNEWC